MQKIILASTLKPVDDTRIYEKFGKSLAKIKNTEVVIFGTESNNTLPYKLEQNIRFEPYVLNKESTRLKMSRLFYYLLKKEQPDLIIIHTIELLPVLLFYKLKNKGVKIFYDILENYPLNFKSQGYYTGIKSLLFSKSAYLIEQIAFPFLTHSFLAEIIYLKEKKLDIKKVTVLENKFVPISPQMNRKNSIHNEVTITMCGTLTKIFGVIQFIEFIENLSSCNNSINYHFKIIGKAYEKDIIDLIRNKEKEFNIECTGIESFVSHSEIIKVMNQSDFVALPYPTNDSTKNCIPTKMFECMALGIPMIIQNNPFWKTIVNPYAGGVFIDFETFEVLNFEEQLLNLKPYPNGINKNALWKTEEHKLLSLLER